MTKPKTVIYGLGKQYKIREHFLKLKFDIIGYSDKNRVSIDNYIEPSKLHEYEFEYVYITSNKYYNEIKNDLITNYFIDEAMIIGEQDTCWYIDNSLTRDRWVINKLQKIPKGKVLLDAGAGEMPYMKYCNHLKYISQDFGEYDTSEKSEGLQLNKWNTSKVNIISDIVHIPLENNSVDAILCTEVFEHIKDPILALKEFKRLCRKDGILLLTAPFCSLTHMAPYYFSNGFSKYWYQEILKDLGFEIVEITANGNYFDYLRQELLRLPDMVKRYCDDVDNININDAITDSLMYLEYFSKKDKSSDEVLCFGYMVEAKKI